MSLLRRPGLPWRAVRCSCSFPAGPAAAAPACRPGHGARLAGRTLTQAQVQNRDLSCADLSGAYLDHLDLTQAQLAGADLRSATAAGTDFSQATLTGADLRGADLAGATFEQASMAGADLAGVSAAGADLSQVDLSSDSLRGAVLPGADLSQDQLRHADLAGADLQGAHLDQADTTRADLAGANLQGASLVEVTDTGAIVRGARGLTPVNSITGVLAVLLGLIALRPRWLRGPPSGRAAALLTSAALLAVGAYLITIATGFRPTADTGFLILIVLLPGLLAGQLYVRAVRQAANATIAAVLATAGALGVYLLLSAAVAYIADPVTDIAAYAQACTGPSCLGGATRGLPGAAAGLVLLALTLAVSRLPGIRRPPDPSRFRWVVTSGGGAGW